MARDYTEITLRGAIVKVPSIDIGDRTVVVIGKWIRMATVHQENWMEGEPVEYPDKFISALRTQKLKADIFSFARRLPETGQLYSYYFECDNLAAIPISTYDDWWEKRLSRKARQEVARAQRLGITVRTAPWDNQLIKGIVDLFGRIPTKQGLPFVHYRKDFDTVKREVSPYVERSQFVVAYYGDQIVGYLKMVFMGRLATILNIICDESHFEKRPANALLAKAVEVCAKEGMQFLIYGKFTYGNKTNDSLAEFKRRNGFEKMIIPRYFVPLSFKGKVAIRLGLHHGLQGLLPSRVILFLVKCRSAIYMNLARSFAKGGALGTEAQGENGARESRREL